MKKNTNEQFDQFDQFDQLYTKRAILRNAAKKDKIANRKNKFIYTTPGVEPLSKDFWKVADEKNNNSF